MDVKIIESIGKSLRGYNGRISSGPLNRIGAEMSYMLRHRHVYNVAKLVRDIQPDFDELYITAHVPLEEVMAYERERGWNVNTTHQPSIRVWSKMPRIDSTEGHPDWGHNSDIGLFECRGSLEQVMETEQLIRGEKWCHGAFSPGFKGLKPEVIISPEGRICKEVRVYQVDKSTYL